MHDCCYSRAPVCEGHQGHSRALDIDPHGPCSAVRTINVLRIPLAVGVAADDDENSPVLIQSVIRLAIEACITVIDDNRSRRLELYRRKSPAPPWRSKRLTGPNKWQPSAV